MARRKPWKFVEQHLLVVLVLIPAVGFLCGVAFGVAHIDPTVPGNPVIGCLLTGAFGAVFLGYMGINLVFTWLRTSRELEQVEVREAGPGGYPTWYLDGGGQRHSDAPQPAPPRVGQ